jgi:hypothetical protein
MYQRDECIAQASICRKKALADPAHYDHWIDQAVVWLQRALQARRGKSGDLRHSRRAHDSAISPVGQFDSGNRRDNMNHDGSAAGYTPCAAGSGLGKPGPGYCNRPARDSRGRARNLGHFLASFGFTGMSIFEPRGAHCTVHNTPRSASSASSRSSRAFSRSGSARANRRNRVERASVMTTPAAARAADRDRRGNRQSLEAFQERRDYRYRCGSGFRGRHLLSILRPMLKGVEGDNPDRVVELPRHQIGDDSFEVCLLDSRQTVPWAPKPSTTR